jgi:[ribosomal protein S5]-alanine N-acetyltransferase
LLTSERCNLSPLSIEDYADIKRLYENERVREYLGGTVDEVEYEKRFNEMIQSQNATLHWSIRLRETDEFIGLVFLDTYHDDHDTEIGYQFLPNYWGKGYATEIITQILKFGVETLGYSTIVAETQSQNKASCHVLQKVGMQYEGELERFGNIQSKFRLIRS